MGTVSVTLPSDGSTIDASDVNSPINTIVAEFNGNIDDDNIKTAANINGSKLLDGSIPGDKADSTFRGGWIAGVLPAVSSVTYNGNRSYDITFASTVASYLTPGMRLRTTRTVTAPTQCTDLESGSSQYYSKTSPSGMTFTDDFVVSAWVKLESYGSIMNIVSRFNGTSGWTLRVNADGTVALLGFNGGASNFSQVISYQSVPLGKWIHVSAQLDMSTFTASTTTSYIMFDGVDIPASVGRGGTNPTALVQAGDLQIGAANATQFFDGKIAQVAIYSAKVTQSTMRTYISQGLSGSETNLISAYSFNNSINDLNTGNANNLTAQGSAVATNADSPFTVDANGTPGGSYDYEIVTKVVTTTATVQVPEGCAIPTSGGVSAVDLSSWKAPFGMPVSEDRWRLASLWRTSSPTTSNATYGAFQSGGWALTVPIGAWRVGWQAGIYNATTVALYWNISSTALTGLSNTAGSAASPFAAYFLPPSATSAATKVYTQQHQTLSSASTYVMYTLGATTSAGADGTVTISEIFSEFALL